MANELDGTRVAFVTANEGVEHAELTEPWSAVQAAGGEPVLIATDAGDVQAFRHLTPSERFTADLATGKARPEDFDALVIPGGVANADQLRTDAAAVRFVQEMFDAGKPAAVICHGPWVLVEAGVVDGRELTSWPSLQTDLRNAGAEWRDETVIVCEDGPNTLVTSRKPDDLPAFDAALVRIFAATRV